MAARRQGFLLSLAKLVALCVVVLYGVVAVTSPWAFHIGGRWTPLLYWSGSGTLVTRNGTYPLYVLIYPGAHFSRLRASGLRPTGGLNGTAALCTSRGVIEQLKLSGTIYNGWSSTDDALIGFRILEYRLLDVGQRQGYIDLHGRWRGPELVMADEGVTGKFRSGLEIKDPSITLDWGSYSDFKAACDKATPAK